MRVLRVAADGELELMAEIPQGWREVIQAAGNLLWVDLNGDQDAAVAERLLAQEFSFHPLAIDDALHETHVPKLDDWQDYLYLVLQDVIYHPQPDKLLQPELVQPELDIFLGKGYLVTYHSELLPAVDQVWEVCQRNNRWLQRGTDHLLYRIIDEIANNYTRVLEQLEVDIVQLESDIFEEPSAAVLERMTSLKRRTLHMRRVLALQREVVNKLSRDTFAAIGAKDRVYFRDVYDHMVRLYDLSDNVRDLVMGSMEIYLSVVNNRMNEVMKTLTVITTLFMPLTFITGFFGMNFFQAVLPSTRWTGGGALGLTLFVMIVLPLSMGWWMRRRAWM